MKDGWISTGESLPDLVDGQDYSKNVWGWDGRNVLVVSFFVDSDGWHWANAYGDVFGEAECDDDYVINSWQPILIPLPPNVKLTGRGAADADE